MSKSSLCVPTLVLVTPYPACTYNCLCSVQKSRSKLDRFQPFFMIAERGQGLVVTYADLCSFLILISPYTLISGGIRNRDKGGIQVVNATIIFLF